jgi:flagellar hook-basal body complex protein FliE
MIEAVSAVTAVVPDAELAGGAPAPAAGFGDLFVSQLNEVNGRLVQAEHEAQQVALGQTDNLHTVMIHMEEAKLSLQLLAQVRNRLLDAYQEVMRMQV